ncbi:MAG: DEAD/DEAH box helicase [Candidatus Nanopelagicaceae bacterium]
MEALTPAERYAASKAKNRHSHSMAFFESFDFELDEFQIAGCYAIEDGKGVLVAAPTGAGKTIVGEFAAYLALTKGKKCFYTTPIKALSNQKYQEFAARFGEANVGLLTGDNNINADAEILVMTTEVLRNMLYTNSSSLINLGFVVMDEVHYLADKFRGAVWEEVLIHLMESVQVISLSATVSNAEEFGEWLQEVRGETKVIVTEDRPVPLYQHVLIGNRLIDLFNEDGSVNQALFRSEKEALRRIRTPARRSTRDSRVDDQNRLTRAEVIEKLNSYQMLPVITFIFSRQGCDSAVKQCLAANLRLTSTEERAEINNIAKRYTESLSSEDLELLGYGQWLSALERGISAHHAGLLPLFKSCVEELFQRGLLKAIFATETLALGINMPARTVFLEKLGKWNGENHVPITPGEYTQLTGRAGRRGIDIEGNAVIQWSPSVDSASAAGLAATRTYPLRSSFSPTYNMAINLLERYGRDRARNSLKSSFAQFQADRAVVGLDRQIRRNQEAVAEYKTDDLCHLGKFSEYAKFRREIKQAEALLSKRNRIDNRQRAHLEQELANYRKSLRQHPCHGCNDREAHARIAERADRLIRENEGLISRVESRTNVIAKTFDRIIEVLNFLGYLEGDEVTPSGRMLSKIYAESDLSIAETIKSGVLEKLSDIEIASVLSIFLFESRKPEAPKIPTSSVQDALSQVVSIWSKLHNLESEYNLKTQREPDFGFCWIAHRWGSGHGLNSVLRNTDLSVGDFVRAMKQLIDLLNQVSIAEPTLRDKCVSAIKKVDRGVVVYLGGLA